MTVAESGGTERLVGYPKTFPRNINSAFESLKNISQDMKTYKNHNNNNNNNNNRVFAK
jgi:hypothetical protein